MLLARSLFDLQATVPWQLQVFVVEFPSMAAFDLLLQFAAFLQVFESCGQF